LSFRKAWDQLDDATSVILASVFTSALATAAPSAKPTSRSRLYRVEIPYRVEIKEGACQVDVEEQSDEARRPGSLTWGIQGRQAWRAAAGQLRRGAGDPLTEQPGTRSATHRAASPRTGKRCHGNRVGARARRRARRCDCDPAMASLCGRATDLAGLVGPNRHAGSRPLGVR
jgi:hypothetical protein